MITEKIDWIGEEAFYNCYNLKNLHIPAFTKSIGS
jgi:hypothetical protein